MMARICPTAMIFVPSIKGISHNPKEYNGYNAKELAQKYELSVNWVLNICKDNPLPEQQSLF